MVVGVGRESLVESVNLMRAILVGTAAIAALISLALGELLIAAVLLTGCAVHGGMWLYIKRRGTHPTVVRDGDAADQRADTTA